MRRSPTAVIRPTRPVRFIYFIQGERTRLIKIGVADDVDRRLATLRLMSPDKLELLGVVVCQKYGDTEKMLHARYAEARAHGEWFYAVPNLVNWIKKRAVPLEQAKTDAAALLPAHPDHEDWLALAGDPLTELDRARKQRRERKAAREAEVALERFRRGPKGRAVTEESGA